MPSSDACAPDVAANGAAKSMAVWYRFDGTDYVIQAARFVGGAWSAPSNVSAAGSDGNSPQVVIDSVGVSTVVWQSTAGGDTRILASRFAAPTEVPLMDGVWMAIMALALALVAGMVLGRQRARIRVAIR